MASVYRLPNDSWRIQFTATGLRRSLIYRGSKREAKTIAERVGDLVRYKRHGLTPSADLSAWAMRLDFAIREKLVEAGLLEPSQAGATLGELVADFTDATSSLAVNTRRNHRIAFGFLLDRFGAGRSVATLSNGDAEDLSRSVAEAGYEPSTVAKTVKYCRQLFKRATAKGWLSRNPFEGVRVKVSIDRAKFFFVPRSVADEILSAIADPELALIFALGRYGGFRCGSEPRALRWSWVDIEKLSLRVWQPKLTSFRVCPMFVELQPYFDRAWEAYADRSEYCCPWLRTVTDAALRNRTTAVLKKIGVDPWPHLWMNLRRTRATEIVEDFGAKAESDWIGHGIDISMRHYQMTTQDKFDRAVGRAPKAESEKERAKR